MFTLISSPDEMETSFLTKSTRLSHIFRAGANILLTPVDLHRSLWFRANGDERNVVLDVVVLRICCYLLGESTEFKRECMWRFYYVRYLASLNWDTQEVSEISDAYPSA